MTTFRVEELSGSRTFRLVGELDVATANQLIEHLQAAVRSGGDISLDLADLQFMDSSGIRALITLCQELDDRGRLVLRSPRGEVATALELIGAGNFPNLVIQRVPAA